MMFNLIHRKRGRKGKLIKLSFIIFFVKFLSSLSSDDESFYFSFSDDESSDVEAQSYSKSVSDLDMKNSSKNTVLDPKTNKKM